MSHRRHLAWLLYRQHFSLVPGYLREGHPFDALLALAEVPRRTLSLGLVFAGKPALRPGRIDTYAVKRAWRRLDAQIREEDSA